MDGFRGRNYEAVVIFKPYGGMPEFGKPETRFLSIGVQNVVSVRGGIIVRIQSFYQLLKIGFLQIDFSPIFGFKTIVMIDGNNGQRLAFSATIIVAMVFKRLEVFKGIPHIPAQFEPAVVGKASVQDAQHPQECDKSGKDWNYPGMV